MSVADMIKPAFLCAIIAVPTEAEALSCVPVDVASSYQEAAKAEETFVIALGEFSFDPSALPTLAPDNENPQTRRIESRFTGGLFTGRSFGFETTIKVTIDARCFGPWCANMDPGAEALAFLEVSEERYTLTLSPCGGRLFPNPTEAALNTVLECHRGGQCRGPQR